MIDLKSYENQVKEILSKDISDEEKFNCLMRVILYYGYQCTMKAIDDCEELDRATRALFAPFKGR